MLRKDFNLSQLPTRAILYVTSLGLVEPHLNGAKVGADYFVPGWTDYNKRVYYRAYDVTSLLAAGIKYRWGRYWATAGSAATSAFSARIIMERRPGCARSCICFMPVEPTR